MPAARATISSTCPQNGSLSSMDSAPSRPLALGGGCGCRGGVGVSRRRRGAGRRVTAGQAERNAFGDLSRLPQDYVGKLPRPAEVVVEVGNCVVGGRLADDGGRGGVGSGGGGLDDMG